MEKITDYHTKWNRKLSWVALKQQIVHDIMMLWIMNIQQEWWKVCSIGQWSVN